MDHSFIIFLTMVLMMITVVIDVSSNTDLVLSLGGSFQISSYILAIRSLATLLTNPLWGTIADTLGRYEVMLYNSIGLSISFLLLGLADNLYMVLISRIIQGSCSGFTIGALSYIADIVPPRDQSSKLGMASAMFGIGFLIAAPLGGVLAARFGFHAPPLLASFTSLLNIIIIFLFLKKKPPTSTETKKTEEKTEKKSVSFSETLFRTFGNIFRLLQNTDLRPLLILRTVVEVSMNITNSANFELIRSSSKFGFDPEQRGFLLMFFGLLSTFTLLNLPNILHLLRHDHVVLITGYVLSIPIALAIPFSPSATVFVMLLCATTIATGCQPALLTGMTSARAKENKGLVMSYGETMVALGGIVGPIVTGLLMPINPALPNFVYAVLMALGIWKLVVGFDSSKSVCVNINEGEGRDESIIKTE